MKVILLAVILQAAAPEPDKPPVPQVMSSMTAEFDSKEACQNAAAGIGKMGDIAGFTVMWGCAPKEVAKLEVEKPKRVPNSHQATS